MSYETKHFATLSARAALCGIALDAIRNDQERHEFIATQGPLCKRLTTLGDVEAWLDRVAAGLRCVTLEGAE
jgi:hypothetical protein